MEKYGTVEKFNKTRLLVRFWRQPKKTPKNRLKVAIFVQNAQNFDMSVCLGIESVSDGYFKLKIYITNYFII